MFLCKSLSPKERVQGAPLLGDSRFEKEHTLLIQRVQVGFRSGVRYP
jgi:hypothetical protein